MKVFSLKKYMEWNGGKATEWAKGCDGQPVKDNIVKDKDGKTFLCFGDDWVEEKTYAKVIFNGNATVLIKDGKKYVSKCKDGDTYDKEKGLLLCLAQANGISYRDLQEMIAGAKDNNAEKAKEFAGKLARAATEAAKAFTKAWNECKKADEKADDKPQVREVKRKAEVGEYIKIVAPDITFGDYEKGAIFKVEKQCSNGVDVEFYGNDENGSVKCTFILDGEYVVLENSTPYKITLSEFWARKKVMAIHCKTEDEAKELLKAFDRMGKRWRDGERYIDDTYHYKYKEKTVYDNTGGFCDVGGSFCSKSNAEIFEFNEVDLSK